MALNPFTKLPKFKSCLYLRPAAPVYCYQNNVILFSSFHENRVTPGIYYYNIDTCKMDLLLAYTGTDFSVVLSANKHCFDSQNCTLYLYHFINSHLFSYDLSTKELKKESIKCEHLAEMFFIPKDNQIHFFTDKDMYNNNNNKQSKQIKINMNDRTKTISSPLNENIKIYDKPIYIPFMKQLMMFGKWDNDKIFYQNVSPNINEDKKWYKYSISTPYNNKYSIFNLYKRNIVIAFDFLLFLFYFSVNEYNGINDIWCLDLKRTNLIRTEYKTPGYMKYAHAYKLNDNMVHFIDFVEGKQCRVSLHSLIPKEIKIWYSKYYELLIIGWINEYENDNIIPTIPYVLKLLIWRYYPPFL